MYQRSPAGALKAQSMGTWPSPQHTFRRRLKSLAGVNRVEEAGLFLGRGAGCVKALSPEEDLVFKE